MDLSIVIPAYNEAKRIGSFLEELAVFCDKSPYSTEIILVDDGSTDETVRVVRDFGRFKNLAILSLGNNQGKGAALRKGVLASQGEVCAFMDADGSYSPDLITKNIHYFKENAQVVIGSRFLSSRNFSESLLRKMLRACFSFFVTVFLFRGIRDTQCGFKLFKKEAAKSIFSQITLTGFGMDLEALYLAKKMKFNIQIVPAFCLPKEGSKVRVFRDSLKLFGNIFEIRFRHF